MSDDAARAKGIELSRRRQFRPHELRNERRFFGRSKRIGERLEREYAVLVRMREGLDAAAFGDGPARFSGIGKKRDGRFGADQDQVFHAGQERDDLFCEIRNARDGNAARALLQSRRERIAHEPRARRGGDAAGCNETLLFERGSANEDGRILAGSANDFRDAIDGLAADFERRRHGHRRGGSRCFEPCRIGGEHQRRNLPGRLTCGMNGARRIGSRIAGAGRLVIPARYRPREPFDVRRERRIVLQVIRRVIAHDVDDGRRGTARVVEVRDAVCKAGPEVQERARRLLRHAPVAVGRARYDAFEKPEHRTHALDRIECGNEVHFGGPGISEADFYAALHERTDDTFGTIHA